MEEIEKNFKNALEILEDHYKKTKKLFPEKQFGEIFGYFFELPNKFIEVLKGREMKWVTAFGFYWFYKEFYILELLEWCGFYHLVFSHLRHILETAITCYYVDKNYFNSDLEFKIKILDELQRKRFIGSKLIKATDLKEESKKELINLYWELSKMVHWYFKKEAEEAKQAEKEKGEEKFRKKLDVMPTQEDFNKCENYTLKVWDAVFFMWLSLFPEVKMKFKEDKELMDILRKHSMELTLIAINRNSV